MQKICVHGDTFMSRYERMPVFCTVNVSVPAFRWVSTSLLCEVVLRKTKAKTLKELLRSNVFRDSSFVCRCKTFSCVCEREEEEEERERKGEDFASRNESQRIKRAKVTLKVQILKASITMTTIEITEWSKDVAPLPLCKQSVTLSWCFLISWMVWFWNFSHSVRKVSHPLTQINSKLTKCSEEKFLDHNCRRQLQLPLNVTKVQK